MDASAGSGLVNVICMKWGTRYGPEYVGRLWAGVNRHLRRRHRFVCFTDDSAGIDERIEVRQLPPITLPAGPERGWRKLAVFAERLDDLRGPTLFLDLDVVITGGLDCFFESPGAFWIIKDWNRSLAPTGNSSVYRFEVGAHRDVLGFFEHNAEWVISHYRNEQRFVSEMMRGQGLLHFWPPEWCRSYKTDCIPAFPINLFVGPYLPEEAKIVVFHGHPKPDEAIQGMGNAWYRPAKAAPWIEQYWRDAPARPEEKLSPISATAELANLR